MVIPVDMLRNVSPIGIPDHHRLLPEDITDWERCNDLIKLVSNEGNRRALWHWAMSKAGRKPFVKWCRSEGIHEETGRRRKDRAILTIEASFVRNILQNNENCPLTMLPTEAVEEHISNAIAADLPKTNRRAWMADGALSSPILADGEYTFEWAEKHNKQRRQRGAAMLKKQAA